MVIFSMANGYMVCSKGESLLLLLDREREREMDMRLTSDEASLLWTICVVVGTEGDNVLAVLLVIP